MNPLYTSDTEKHHLIQSPLCRTQWVTHSAFILKPRKEQSRLVPVRTQFAVCGVSLLRRVLVLESHSRINTCMQRIYYSQFRDRVIIAALIKRWTPPGNRLELSRGRNNMYLAGHPCDTNWNPKAVCVHVCVCVMRHFRTGQIHEWKKTERNTNS